MRQTILEPEERVWIGESPPDRHDASMCIATIRLRNAGWLVNREIAFSPGLVAIIGSRGSGKTALADVIAVGAGVTSPLDLDSSFLSRASRPVNHLGNAHVDLVWRDNECNTRPLLSGDQDEESRPPERVRYLSQQFVEQLCSADGLADELRREIERVIFEATDATDRFDADSFEQLAEIHLNPLRSRRQTAKEAIEHTSLEINAEDALHGRLPGITKNRNECEGRIKRTKADMAALIPSGNEERARRLAALEAALATSTTAIDKQRRVLVRVEDLEKEVVQIRKTRLPQQLTQLRNSFKEAGLSDVDWQMFEMAFKGDVDSILASRKAAITQQITRMTEGSPGVTIDTGSAPAPTWPWKTLRDERDRVKKDVGIDAQKQRRYGELQRALGEDERLVQRLTADQVHAEGAATRRKGLTETRRALYLEVFQSYLDEQKELERLYGPLQNSLTEAHGSLNRLHFAVSRDIDLGQWILNGETLFDLRRDSRLKGHGALEAEATRLLMPAWKNGTAEEVAAAMQRFIQEMFKEFERAKPATITDAQTPEWMQQIAAWVYSTDHLEMRYSVTYDGVAIEQLSPGTRGIVLLLLYLVIDKHDRRPLIIDQPEESLDPKSVFDELVPHFREARRRRQVIIVTHNANLVVNTDADQVIVASSERNSSGGLPTVTYRCGTLENPDIRTAVCEILEGGERAFLDRERRYRLHWRP